MQRQLAMDRTDLSEALAWLADLVASRPRAESPRAVTRAWLRQWIGPLRRCSTDRPWHRTPSRCSMP